MTVGAERFRRRQEERMAELLRRASQAAERQQDHRQDDEEQPCAYCPHTKRQHSYIGCMVEGCECRYYAAAQAKEGCR